MKLSSVKIATLLIGAASLFPSQTAWGATSVSQFGITWTFDRNYPVGIFANGDWWVVGPVNVTAISPNGIDIHGSMVNPVINGDQGYDARIRNNKYTPSLNVARTLPLLLTPDSSLVSAESYGPNAAGDDPQIKTIAILTVLDKAPTEGTFRPTYLNAAKTLKWNKSQLDYSRLRSFPSPSSAPALVDITAAFEKPWIEQKTDWTGRYMHPGGNQPTYGREMAHTLGAGLLSLQLNYSNKEKEKLLVRLVQYGLDIYAGAAAGAGWYNDGGHNQGRKMPLLLAATMLNDPAIKAWGNAQLHPIFQEDQQTWFVTASDVGRVLNHRDGRPRVEYLTADIGLAEWGMKHATQPANDGRNWDSFYRIVSGAPTIGHVLVARIMGLEADWNWPACFAYYDRYWTIERTNYSAGPNGITPFVGEMWQKHRGNGPAAPTRLRIVR